MIHFKVSSSSLLSIVTLSQCPQPEFDFDLLVWENLVLYTLSVCLGVDSYFPSSIRDHLPYRAYSLLFFLDPRIITHEKAQGPSPLAVVIFCFSIDCGIFSSSTHLLTRWFYGSTPKMERALSTHSQPCQVARS